MTHPAGPCVYFVDLETVPSALTHSHPACSELTKRGRGTKRRGQDASFPIGNGAKVKRKI